MYGKTKVIEKMVKKNKNYSYVLKHFDRKKRSPKFKNHSVFILFGKKSD